MQDVLGCIGGVQALFPILETVAQREYACLLSVVQDPSSPTVEKPEVDGWEVLPSSSYAGFFRLSNSRVEFFNLSLANLIWFNIDWKLEQNPVSGFLSLLRNVLHRHPRNTEQLLEGSNIAIIGSLMQKVTISFYNVTLSKCDESISMYHHQRPMLKIDINYNIMFNSKWNYEMNNESRDEWVGIWCWKGAPLFNGRPGAHGRAAANRICPRFSRPVFAAEHLSAYSIRHADLVSFAVPCQDR